PCRLVPDAFELHGSLIIVHQPANNQRTPAIATEMDPYQSQGADQNHADESLFGMSSPLGSIPNAVRNRVEDVIVALNDRILGVSIAWVAEPHGDGSPSSHVASLSPHTYGKCAPRIRARFAQRGGLRTDDFRKETTRARQDVTFVCSLYRRDSGHANLGR